MHSLLIEWELELYENILKHQQLVSIDDCKNVTVEQLVGFGFKMGHAKRFVRNIKNYIDSKPSTAANVSVVLLGETGIGKSTLMHSIEAYFNDTQFENVKYVKRCKTSRSQTQECVMRTFKLTTNATTFTIIDTPGIGDASCVANDRKNISKIIQCLLKQRTINVFAFLIHRGTKNLSNKLKYVLNEFKCWLPASAMNHFMVVLTRSAV